MNEIKKYSLKSLYDISSGISSTKEQAGHGAPFVSFSTVFNNYFLPEELPDKMDTSDKDQESCSVKAGDIFITRTSETIDELAMSCVATKDYPKATFSGFLKRLRPKTQGIVYYKYLAFYLRGRLFRQAVDNNAFMTLRASFNEEIFSYLDIYLPSYDQQITIGDFLYALEQKKQLNLRICAELESMAKTLYEYWFVQFDFPDENGKPYKTSGGAMECKDSLKREVPKGWKYGNIYELGTIVSGATPSTQNPDYYSDNGIAWITPNDLSGKEHDMFISHGERDITQLGYDSCSTVLIPSGSVLMSSRAPIGYLAIAANEVCTNQGFKSIICNKGFCSEFVYYTLQHNIPRIAKKGSGTTFAEVSKDSLGSFGILVPPIEIIDKFNSIVNPMCLMRKEKEKESIELSKVRNELLPVLMNGQATLKESL